MSLTRSAPFRVERLSDTHDRTAFVSGVGELDHYFRYLAGQDARRNVAAPFVMLDAPNTIVGYYTLSAYSLLATELPLHILKKLPKYPLIPVTLLGRLAIGRERQGQKLGRILLMDALYRSWKNSSEIASVGVVVDALDDNARSFYLHHEFTPLEAHPNKLFMVTRTIEKAFR